ncbi:MAG: hypothetical protein OI715_00805 (plasmid) [Candidatus Methanoperedens sp.]|nr:MAG: hypothetical protein OI715_00805 [Candidatus Methanoperedens sp.]
MKDNIERIPMFVESQRGDDRIGTGQDGNLISDHEASEKGAPFEPGVPKEKISEAVEAQLKDDKWVVLEKKDGSSELLTKGDLPKPEERKENVPQEKASEGTAGAGTGDPKVPEKPGEDDWRSVFSAVPVKQKPEPKPEPKPDPKAEPKPEDAAVKPAANSTVKPACTAGPKKEKETWTRKFENIKSATATHKGKGG